MESRIARAVRSNAKREAKTRGHCHWALALSIVLLFAFYSLPIPMIAQAGWFLGYGYRKSHTIKGRFAVNYAGGTVCVDSRRIVALWLSCPPPPVPEFPLGALFPLLTCLAIYTTWKCRQVGGRSG